MKNIAVFCSKNAKTNHIFDILGTEIRNILYNPVLENYETPTLYIRSTPNVPALEAIKSYGVAYGIPVVLKDTQEELISVANAAIVIWNGVSKGTLSDMEALKARCIPYKMYSDTNL